METLIFNEFGEKKVEFFFWSWKRSSYARRSANSLILWIFEKSCVQIVLLIPLLLSEHIYCVCKWNLLKMVIQLHWSSLALDSKLGIEKITFNYSLMIIQFDGLLVRSSNICFQLQKFQIVQTQQIWKQNSTLFHPMNVIKIFETQKYLIFFWRTNIMCVNKCQIFFIQICDFPSDSIQLFKHQLKLIEFK